MRIRRNPPANEVRDIIHGEEARARRSRTERGAPWRRLSLQPNSGPRSSGPFWMRQRPDERREVDVRRKRKFGSCSEARDVIHGEGTSEMGRNERQGRRQSQEFTYRRRPEVTNSGTRIPGPFWIRRRPDERREVDVPRRRKFVNVGEGRSGPSSLPVRRRPSTSSDASSPFWLQERADERRNPDFLYKKKFEKRPEVGDVIHGEEARARERQERGRVERPINLYDLPPGPSHADPFWLLERQDERRDPDMDRKRKFERKKIEVAEIIHGEDFREQWNQNRGRNEEQVPAYLPNFDEDEASSDSEGETYKFTRACRCAPLPLENFPDMDRDWNNVVPDIPDDIEEVIRETPAARVSCAPQADVANFDQPSTFMRKLYEKYPYLYQILKDSPPEELASTVFKDRFLSTYQVDYLHLGVGNIGASAEGRGAENREEAPTGPDGEPEPQAVPGCSYRRNQKGNFGRKKVEYPERENNKDNVEVVQEEKQESDISEYMATISRLGGEIISDELYRGARLTKNMKNDYKKM